MLPIPSTLRWGLEPLQGWVQLVLVPVLQCQQGESDTLVRHHDWVDLCSRVSGTPYHGWVDLCSKELHMLRDKGLRTLLGCRQSTLHAQDCQRQPALHSPTE